MKLTAVIAVLSLFCGAASAQFIDRTNSGVEAERNNARRAAVSAAQGEVDRAQASLDAVSARIAAAWKANPDLLAANKELAVKQSAYDRARQPILDKLSNDPAYKVAMLQAQTADQAVKAEQSATTRPTHVRVGAVPATLPGVSDMQVQAATEKLEQKSAMRDMEEKAITADPTAAQARSELDAARERVKVLQLQFDAMKKNDPEFKAALENLNAAKSRLTAASGQN